MKISVLSSGSNGNCAIITDSIGNQLVIDCGIKYDSLVSELNWSKPVSVLISHKHADHYNAKTIKKITMFGVPIFDEDCFENNAVICVQYWKVLTICLPHSKDSNSWAFLMYHTVDKKTVFFATDCTKLPNIADRELDLIMVENNYSEIKVLENECAGVTKNSGYANHLSVEQVFDWLSRRKSKCRNLLITHLSNSGNISIDGLDRLYVNCAYRIFFATKKMSFIF